MKKKKIFIYIHQCILKGGVEKVFYNLLNNLSPDKYDVTVLCVMAYLHNDTEINLYPSFVKRRWLYYDDWSSNWIIKTGQRIHNKFFPIFYKWYLKKCHFDVAIAAQEGTYAKFIIDNINATKKLLWIHNDMSICHWTENFFGGRDKEKLYYQQFDNIVCVSETVKSSMIQEFGNLENLCVRYNPIDTIEIDKKLKENLPQRGTEMLFVCVGRLTHQKGFDRLIQVCKKLNSEGYRYTVWIVGEGEKRVELQNMINTYNVFNIHILGNQKNPFVYMKQADWLLLPSRHEGFCMVLQEALYCGTPIITTLVSGAKELLGESEFGIVVENSEEGIYEGMKSVMNNPVLYKKYVEMSGKRRSFVDIQKRVSNIETLF